MKASDVKINVKRRKDALRERFIWPPFSVLNTMSGGWIKRRRKWLGFGIKGEIGRDTKAFTIPQEWFHKVGHPLLSLKSCASVFDPFLCELMYTWFCPLGGQVVDPFAGGSVRGIVASMLGCDYWGCDLSLGQIEANVVQGESICNGRVPEWVCGDALEMLNYAPHADFLLSCPPYGNLERYSKDSRDLSNMTSSEFFRIYAKIVKLAVGRLKEDRFACFVVGNYRGDGNGLIDLVGDTVVAFEEAGAVFYNDFVLLNSPGSLPLRTPRYFRSSRKMGRQHQYVLVFVKGDPRKAASVLNANPIQGDPDGDHWESPGQEEAGFGFA